MFCFDAVFHQTAYWTTPLAWAWATRVAIDIWVLALWQPAGVIIIIRLCQRSTFNTTITNHHHHHPPSSAIRHFTATVMAMAMARMAICNCNLHHHTGKNATSLAFL